MAGQFTWTQDSPTGPYKNHALAAKLYEASLPETVFTDFPRPVPAFGKRSGETVTWIRVRNLAEPTSPVLSEVERIPEDIFALSTGSATIQAIGRAVPYTSFADDLSFFDISNPIQNKLRMQMAQSIDTLAATAYKGGLTKYVPTGAASRTITTNGVAGAAATSNMNFFHLEEIRDYLYDTANAPTIGGDYVGIFRSLSVRGIRRDSEFEEWFKYTTPQAKFNNERFKVESIRIIENNHNNALGKIGTGAVLGEGVVFGDDACVMAEAVTPELRIGMDENFGLSKSVAWYGVLRYQSVWDSNSANAGEARIVHVTST